jgi:TMAO reductase system sensor TorS
MNVMGLGVLSSLTISMLAFGGTLVLLRQLRNRRFWILVAVTAFISAATAMYSGAQFITNPFDLKLSGSDFRDRFPDIILSIMALMAVYYLERLIRERKALEKELRLREFSVERVALAAFWIRRDGQILFVNQEACKCLDFSRSELLSKTIYDIDPNLTPGEWAGKWASIKHCGSLAFETLYRTKDGQLIPVDVTSNLLELDGEEYSCTFARDITERKRAQEAIQESKQALRDRIEQLEEAQRKLEQQAVDLVHHKKARTGAEQASQAKSVYLATMSHEIRTPMNGVLGMLRLLLDSGLSGQQWELAQTAQTSAEDLLTILNDIIDYSKLEAGRIELEDVSFSPGQVLGSAVSLFRARAGAKGLDLSVDPSSEIPQWVQGDPTRLRQILLNLVGNAIKFTHRGSVQVMATHRVLDGSSLELHISVSDTGIGIRHEDQTKIFDRFCQANSTTARKFGGSGLGLTICKQLVELMDGKIGVESNVGQGSTFWFTIHCTAGAPPQDTELFDIEVLPAAPRLRILVAEDSPVNQMVVKMFLEKEGHQVVVVENGLEALQAIKMATYDLVLMDIQMPEMDGLIAARTIRGLEGEISDIPIIAITGNAMTGDQEEYLAAGMNDYLAKPYDPQQLMAAIARVTEMKPGIAQGA